MATTDNREQRYPERPPQGPQPVFGVSPNLVPVPPIVATVANNYGARYREIGVRIRIAFFGTLLFLVLSQPATYRIINAMYNAVFNKQPPLTNEIATVEGFPTYKGLFLGGVLFFAVLFLILHKV